MIKSVLVTGNKGYIGSVLTMMLKDKGYEVRGLDTDFYEGFDEDNHSIEQITKDVRDINPKDLKDIDAIIHLAALSNDPLGELNPDLTRDINFVATVKLARMAKDCGVKRFIFASSQSMYGISETEEELNEDSEKNPVTEYAKTKWLAEKDLKKFASEDFTVVFFRPSTVFGVSPKLRADIVFNNLLACGYTTGKIEMRSDGSPWRPVVHIRDVSNAFISGLEAPAELVNGKAFNIGIKNGNYRVRDLAEAAQKTLGEKCLLSFGGKKGDKDSRTYKVSFNKILTELKDYYKPEYDLEKGGKELLDFFEKIGFNEETFKGRKCIRLNQLKYLIENKELDENLFWIKNSIKQAVVLAGGTGTRLNNLGHFNPKPMIDINGKPFLERVIEKLKRNRVEEVILLLGYRADKIKNYFGDGSKFGIKIKYSIGDVSFDTGKRLKDAEELLDGQFFLLYCDNYINFDIRKIKNFHDDREVLMTTSVYSNKDNFTKSNMLVDEAGFVKNYDKERKSENLNGTELSFAIVSKKVLDLVPKGENYPFHKVFPELIEKNQLAGYVVDERYCSIGDIARVPLARDYFSDRKVVFLDRDGTINRLAPPGKTIDKWDDFEFLPGALEALKKLTEKGHEIYLITNQPGIGKGNVTEKQVKEIHEKMIDEIEKNGGKIRAIYHCPHAKNGECDCRKPKAGMIFQAQRDNNIDLSKALFIGDDERDVEAGQEAGVRTFLITENRSLLDIVNSLDNLK